MEDKTGANSLGVISVGATERAPDPITGRAVFVDDTKYAEDITYKGKVDELVRQGFHLVGDVSSGGCDCDMSPLILHILTDDHNVMHLDKTFSEIKDAWLSGKQIILDPVVHPTKIYEALLNIIEFLEEPGGGEVVFPYLDYDEYLVHADVWTADSASGYPKKPSIV